MPSCLGLYIENNIIKYAKVSKDSNNTKIDAFGVVFYDKLTKTIKQIVDETYSYKEPITINLLGEKYTSSQLFKLLNKKDLGKAVETEFEYYCEENGLSKNTVTYKNLLMDNTEDSDKIISLYVYANKTEFVEKVQDFSSYNLRGIVPLPLTIQNLLKEEPSNVAIINIENKTTISTIINGKINSIDVLENGMKQILDNLAQKENSFSKAYEICKNTTIYTTEGKDLELETNEHLADIMPLLYEIIQNVQSILSKNSSNINNIYITGTGAIINNIDLYFQEYFPNSKCEILKPYFMEKIQSGISIKDYIEVNSAVSLALYGIGEGIKEVNFKVTSSSEKLASFLKVEKRDTKKTKLTSKINFNGFKMFEFDQIEKYLFRFLIFCLLLIIIYSVFSGIIYKKIEEKDEQAETTIEYTNLQIGQINNDISRITSQINKYEELIIEIDELNKKAVTKYTNKNMIPNFLKNIMSVIPVEVQLVSITNTTDRYVEITARATEYQQIAYFIAKLKNDSILSNVSSTPGIKEEVITYPNQKVKSIVVTVTIKGEIV